MGTVWLPEDLLYCMAKFADLEDRKLGLWGKPLGAQLQSFLARHGRPLIWADGDDSPQLLDPIVDGVAGGRITEADRNLFKTHWRMATSPGFKDLFDASPNRLR